MPVRLWLLLTHNWKLKLASVAASLLLFSYIQYTKNIRRTLHVRVKRPELAKGLMFASKVPSFINVEISGNEEIRNFEASEFRIHLRLANPPALPGKENVFRTILYPELPEGVHVRYQKEISVLLDRILERELPIVPVIQAALPRNKELGFMQLEPPTVRIVGPLQVVSELEEVRTHPVKIIDESIFQKPVQLTGVPDFVTLAKGEGDLTSISIRVIDRKPGQNTLLLKELPLRCANPTPGLKMRVLGSDTVDLLLKVEEGGEVAASQFEASVFCPVFYDSVSKQIRPGFHIKDKPVMVHDKLSRLNVRILKVLPAFVSMQFERIEREIPANPRNTRQQGLREHLLPRP